MAGNEAGGIALENEYGSLEASQKLVANQMQLGDPEAAIALLNPEHEINAHFSMSPYLEMALNNPCGCKRTHFVQAADAILAKKQRDHVQTLRGLDRKSPTYEN
jgi:hypothetical protein